MSSDMQSFLFTTFYHFGAMIVHEEVVELIVLFMVGTIMIVFSTLFYTNNLCSPFWVVVVI
uniref:Uncharacterized protein n=1 Tax=Arundo donax TaxID=35708 RepID=A0A0A9DPX9_ARUDO